MLAFLTIPATAGLLVLGVPIVRLLYERGRFTPADTQDTATALVCYSLGLVAYTGRQGPGARLLRARHAARPAARRALLAVVTNLAVILPGPRASASARGARHQPRLARERGLLVVAFERRVGGLFGHGLLRPAAADGCSPPR